MNSEFKNIANYLLGVKLISDEMDEKYEEAISKIDCNLDSFESKIWKRMLKNKFLFTSYDGALGLIKPHSHIRKRILIALALLECSPDFIHYFQSKKTTFTEITQLLINLPIAIVSAILGVILVKLRI